MSAGSGWTFRGEVDVGGLGVGGWSAAQPGRSVNGPTEGCRDPADPEGRALLPSTDPLSGYAVAKCRPLHRRASEIQSPAHACSHTQATYPETGMKRGWSAETALLGDRGSSEEGIAVPGPCQAGDTDTERH